MNTDEDLTILSVDDNPMIAEAIERIVASTAGLRLEGHFFSGEGVIEAVMNKRPSVVLLDLEMPDTDTFALIQQLTELAPETKVLMLSGHVRRDDILSCVNAGAFGYIHKSRRPHYIVETIRKVAAGEFVLCDEAARASGFN